MVVSVSLHPLQSAGSPQRSPPFGPCWWFQRAQHRSTFSLRFAVWCCSCFSGNTLTCFQIYCFHPEGRRTQKTSPRLKKGQETSHVKHRVSWGDFSAIWSNRQVIPVCAHNEIMHQSLLNKFVSETESLPRPFDCYFILNQTCKSITRANEQMPAVKNSWF